jgi:predicted lipid-binding transport protein (Tim44 family)
VVTPEQPSPPAAQPAVKERARTAGRPQHAIPGLAGAVVPLFIGLAVGLHWFVGGGGLPSLLIAVALVAYGAKQLQRIRRQQSYEHSQAAARIAQMLGQIRK